MMNLNRGHLTLGVVLVILACLNCSLADDGDAMARYAIDFQDDGEPIQPAVVITTPLRALTQKEKNDKIKESYRTGAFKTVPRSKAEREEHKMAAKMKTMQGAFLKTPDDGYWKKKNPMRELSPPPPTAANVKNYRSHFDDHDDSDSEMERRYEEPEDEDEEQEADISQIERIISQNPRMNMNANDLLNVMLRDRYIAIKQQVDKMLQRTAMAPTFGPPGDQHHHRSRGHHQHPHPQAYGEDDEDADEVVSREPYSDFDLDTFDEEQDVEEEGGSERYDAHEEEGEELKERRMFERDRMMDEEEQGEQGEEMEFDDPEMMAEREEATTTTTYQERQEDEDRAAPQDRDDNHRETVQDDEEPTSRDQSRFAKYLASSNGYRNTGSEEAEKSTNKNGQLTTQGGVDEEPTSVTDTTTRLRAKYNPPSQSVINYFKKMEQGGLISLAAMQAYDHEDQEDPRKQYRAFMSLASANPPSSAADSPNKPGGQEFNSTLFLDKLLGNLIKKNLDHLLKDLKRGGGGGGESTTTLSSASKRQQQHQQQQQRKHEIYGPADSDAYYRNLKESAELLRKQHPLTHQPSIGRMGSGLATVLRRSANDSSGQAQSMTKARPKILAARRQQPPTSSSLVKQHHSMDYLNQFD